jgi:hypothetical protein
MVSVNTDYTVEIKSSQYEIRTILCKDLQLLVESLITAIIMQ